jgi:alpha-1,6-mannosyltransferase
MAPAFAALVGLGLLALALRTRRSGTADLSRGLERTALLLVAFLLAVTPTFPWYFLSALPMMPLLGLWSPYALATGGFLLYGFQANAPPFFGRWALLMGIAAAAAIRDLTHRVREGDA